MNGYIVFAHGSSIESANEAVRETARRAARAGRWKKFAAAFLGGGEPDLLQAIARLAGEGVTRIVVIPYFLTPGLHLERDLPALIEQAETRGNVEIEVTPPLDGHPALVEALVDRSKNLCRAR
ncbi:MAG TPA: CbiX/SirB N-terminal domain-containing protein [Bryobacteraceae bacterium]|jgi:sirohydrochlorin ferrochelatase|nr:CbiX/SirB N-terminal domain-containing protein [Bryobacteraceae bacterium]